MAAHHPGVSQTPTTSFNLPPQIYQNEQNQQDSLSLVEEVIRSDSEDVLSEAELEREAERQSLFQKVTNNAIGRLNGYRKVEVLLIRWEDSIDQSKGHIQEVQTSDQEHP
jgi:hypothetical protein